MQIISYSNLLVIKNPDNGISITINKSDIRFIKEYDMFSYEDIPNKSIHILGAFFEIFDNNNNSFLDSDSAYNYLLFLLTDNSILNIGNKTGVSNEGGLLIKLTNNTGSPTVKGSLVSSSPNINDGFILQNNEFDTIGVVYENGIADGEETYIVVSGIAEVLLKDGTASTRGYWAIAADTDGRANITQPTPSPNNTLNEHTIHFKEIGHCIETKSAGSNVLAKCILHFN